MIPVMRHIVEFNSALTKFVCVDRAQTGRSTIFRNSEIQSSKYIAIADDLHGAGVRLEMMQTCFVNKLLLYYMTQCHAQGFGSCFKCWPFNDTLRDIFLYKNTDQPRKVVLSRIYLFIEAE